MMTGYEDLDNVDESEFAPIDSDVPESLPDVEYWGKHTITNDREVVLLYRVCEESPSAGMETPYLEVSWTYYYQYRKTDGPPHTNEGTAHSSSQELELEGVYDLEELCSSHFADAADGLVEEFNGLLDEGKL